MVGRARRWKHGPSRASDTGSAESGPGTLQRLQSGSKEAGPKTGLEKTYYI